MCKQDKNQAFRVSIFLKTYLLKHCKKRSYKLQIFTITFVERERGERNDTPCTNTGTEQGPAGSLLSKRKRALYIT